MARRVLWIMLDSVGIGASNDAPAFGDVGANTLLHIAKACADGIANINRSGTLSIPNLTRMGLVRALHASCGSSNGLVDTHSPIGAYGYGVEVSKGKDTPSGHWEMAGVPVRFDWFYFPSLTDSFPDELLQRIMKHAKISGFLGNCHASGTDIINTFGAKHMETGYPIFYTSADSVFQVACHEETFGLQRLYDLCALIRNECPHTLGRVIARPFIGTKDSFVRTGNRRDYAIEPPSPTILDMLKSDGKQVIGIGKIPDIFAHRGFTAEIHAHLLPQLIDTTYEAFTHLRGDGLVFANFVDFDSLYGHRRDISGYAKALEFFDAALPRFLDAMQSDDLLVITADHGNDPSWHGSDHTREHVPILFYSPSLMPKDIGRRSSFADVAQTLCQFFAIKPIKDGISCLDFSSFPFNH